MSSQHSSSVCNMFWMGSLGAIERACMRSVVRQGHRLRLWSYGPVDGLPEDIENADAAEILPQRAIIRHRASGSIALFSNWFRYELQRRSLGTWLDCDVYLVRPVETERPYLLAEEKPGLINTAVLRLPPDSPMLRPLLRLFRQRTVPFWLSRGERLGAYKRLLLTGRIDLPRMSWGVAGPAAMTALSHRHGLTALAARPEVYHPVHWEDASWINDPSLTIDQMIKPETRAIHLWNESIKALRDSPPPPGSFLARLHEEGA